MSKININMQLYKDYYNTAKYIGAKYIGDLVIMINGDINLKDNIEDAYKKIITYFGGKYH